MRASLIVTVAVALTLGAYYPIVLHPNSTVLLAPGDLTSSARDYWAAGYEHKNPFTFVDDRMMDVPQGRLMAPAVQIANAVQPLFVLALHGVAGYLGAFNAFMLFGVAASLASMFFLLDRLGLHPVAAAAGAVAFGSCQWSIEQLLYGHAAFAQLWVFPLLLGSLLWARRGRPARAAVAGLAYALSFYVSSYLGLLCSLVVVLYLVALAWDRRRLGVDVPRLAFGVAAAVVGLLPAILAPLIAPTSRLGLPQRPRDDLFGAGLRDFVLPSTRHVVYGHEVQELAGRHVGELVVFFGYGTIALAGVAVAMLVRRRLSLSLPLRFALLAVPFGLLCALPAHEAIFGSRVAMPDPANLIGGLVSWWRVYDRFGVVTGFGLVLLASVAIDRLVRSGRRTGVIAAGIGVAAIVLEALPGAPVPTYDMRADAATTWLRARPGGAVATYPVEPKTLGDPAWENMRWASYYGQVYHHHPVFTEPQEVTKPTVSELVAMLAGNLADPRTPGILRAEGVRWVVERKDVYRAMGEPVPRPAHGLAPSVALPGAEVLRVTAPPANVHALVSGDARVLAHRVAVGNAVVSFGDGFYPAERYDRYRGAHWMQQDGKLLVHLGVEPLPFVVYDLRIRLFSSRVPRTVTVFDDAQRIASFKVSTSEVIVNRRLQFPAAYETLTFTATPRPLLNSGSDTRSVSVFFESVDVIPVGLKLER